MGEIIVPKLTLHLITIFILTIGLLTACQSSQPNTDTTSTDPEVADTTDEQQTDSEPVSSESTDDEASDEIMLPDVELQKGDQGEAVKALQQALIHIGYPIEVTGVYDEDTTWAITDLQLQDEQIYTTGVYQEDTKWMIEQALAGGIEVSHGEKLPRPGQQEQTDKKIVENPHDILVLVNKEYALPADYVPEDLVIPNVRFPFVEDLPKKQLREVAARALEELFAAADQEGLELFAISGYRSYDRQEAIFAANVQKHGEEAANRFSARPGESEHQTGLTMDVSSPSVGFDLVEEFGNTPEGQWLKKHASDFGFIIRYPEGKEHITLYQYEPWHLRYVGKKAAKEIMEKGITLEEYLEQL